jgi:hypothetical protein
MTIILWNIIKSNLQGIGYLVMLATTFINIFFYMNGPKEPFFTRLIQSYKKAIVISIVYSVFIAVSIFLSPVYMDILDYLCKKDNLYQHISMTQFHIGVFLFFLTGPLLTFVLYTLGKKTILKFKLIELYSDKKDVLYHHLFISILITLGSALFLIITPETGVEDPGAVTTLVMLVAAATILAFDQINFENETNNPKSQTAK